MPILFSLCSHLAKKVGCFCILATHYHELCTLVEEAKAVVNMHFSAMADENGLTMLYKLENGPCDRSFGIHVTQVTDFPPHVIEVRIFCSVGDGGNHLGKEDNSKQDNKINFLFCHRQQKVWLINSRILLKTKIRMMTKKL